MKINTVSFVKRNSYAYSRFSSSQQAEGDSYRRQIERAKKFCDEHNLELNETRFEDLGVSGYTGENIATGALGDFIAALEAGKIPQGSVLIVENWDRFSRLEPMEARTTLGKIIKGGVDVVTLEDGKFHTKENYNDFTNLITSIVQNHGWEIAGMTDELLERYSQRSAARDAGVAAEEKKLGRQLTNDERAVVVRETRETKLKEISTAEVRALQRGRLSRDELAELGKVRAAAVGARPVQMEPPKRVLGLAAEHCFERRTVVAEHDLLASALRFGYGRLDVAALKSELKNDAGFLKAGGKVTTAASLQRELDVVEFVASTRGKFPALGVPVKNDRLSPEQAQAVANVLSCRDQAVVLRGSAGVGKTTVLSSIIEGSKDDVLVFAPTTKAVEVLQKDGGASRAGQVLARTQTVQALLQSPRLQADCRNKVVVVDEYSLLSLRQLHELTALARRQNARLIFSGDSRQHLSVEAGDAARIVERETPVRVVNLKTIRRQVPAKYRAAVQSLADGRTAKGLKQLDALGAVVEVTDRDARLARMVDDYLSASAETKTIVTRHGKKSSRKDCIMVAPTWAEIDDLTTIVRDRLKQGGELQPEGVKFTALKNLDWTVAERKDLKKFRGGEVLVFHRPAAGFAKGEEVRAVRLHKGKLEVRRADGRVVAVTGNQAGSFSVFKEKELELCPGDKLRLQTPCVDARGRKLANGSVVTLDGVTADGKLKLAGGREISTRQLTHGYAMTSASNPSSFSPGFFNGDGFDAGRRRDVAGTLLLVGKARLRLADCC